MILRISHRMAQDEPLNVSACVRHSISMPSMHGERLIVCRCVFVLTFSVFHSSLPHSTCTLTFTLSSMWTAPRETTPNEESCPLAGYTPPTLYEAAFVKLPALGVVKRQRRSQSGSRSSSVFRCACVKDHDPVASNLAVWAESNPRILAAHALQQMVDQLSRKDRRRDCPLVATSHLHQILDRLAAGQFGRAAGPATQRHKALDMATQDGDWKRASHL